VTTGAASRTALVTGAARGIGAAVAGRLSKDGLAIAVVDVNECDATVESIRAAGGSAEQYRCDVRDFEAVGSAVAAIEARQGPISVVASVAGIWEGVPFLELDPDSWHRLLDVNLTGSFHVCRHAAAAMVSHGGGSIVCVASNAAYLAWYGGAHYTASKAGLVGLVKAMAFELGPRGIRVNAVAPGTVRTPASEVDLADPDVEAIQVAACPIGRIGVPADIAEAVAYLADADRAAWVTGTTLLVDGGFGTHGEGAHFASGTSTVPSAMLEAPVEGN
jgi:NAD(P)-dependent dehydrogenase (short-subunit alcohol dehydrogenase family)